MHFTYFIEKWFNSILGFTKVHVYNIIINNLLFWNISPLLNYPTGSEWGKSAYEIKSTAPGTFIENK